MAFAKQFGGALEAGLKDLTSRVLLDTSSLPPILPESDCASLILQASDGDHAAVETVFRERFYSITASASIDEPSFLQIWYLLDTANILSDKDLCQAGLGLWLIEELLDSQTIDGCRKIFDYLESRRERIIAQNWKAKELIVLRSCNELLRRLSRAEDTVFCGRVSIFLFQSFPLGDKSSVNLRGEFHVENITSFDEAPQKSEDAIKPMEIDSEACQPVSSRPQTPSSGIHDVDSQKTARSTPGGPKAVVATKMEESPPDLDALYPVFWSLQSLFSSPTRLFDPANMVTLKTGVDLTLSVFQKIHTNTSEVRGTKRKRSENTSSAFNPKYLTNRDLFDLEIHDISFRRNFLVQSLILLDFLLSLAPQTKARLANLQNKSVLYSYILSEEDAKWATATRATIISYLSQQGNNNEGRFYLRMVDTVLSRDKNWVRWKAENCPSISREPVNVSAHIEAQNKLKNICKTKNLPLPPGAENLAFLAKSEPMEALKNPDKRQKIPTMEKFYKGIQNDELDAEMGTPEEIEAANEAKEAKIWRALRASGRRFVLSDKIQNGKNLKALIGVDEQENVPPSNTEAEAEAEAEATEENVDGVEEPVKMEVDSTPATTEEVLEVPMGA